MSATWGPVDSASAGDPARFRSLPELERSLEGLRAPPGDGRVVLVVRRAAAGGRREVLRRAQLSPEAGVVGDAWSTRPPAHPARQIAVVQAGVAELVANGQPLTLFGDNLFLDLDVSAGNLPPGSRLRVGAALLEVTPEPHRGCRKFQSRFGADALRFVAAREREPRRLRGVYMRVVEAGEVAAGDAARVLARPGPQRPT